MKKTLYFECNAGISGDMTVAALLDLGADQKVLMDVLDSLPVDGFSVEIDRVKKAGIDCCDFDVILDREHENRDHDMAYLHGGTDHKICTDTTGHEHTHEHSHTTDEHGHTHEHSHTMDEQGHTHEHSHSHSHGEHSHSHQHRGLPEIMGILEKAQMTDAARKLAVQIFQILAQAEAKAHNAPVDEVHFHEVGAVDSVVDIVAAAVCFDNLGITDVIVPKLCEGTGSIRCQHGILPVPVPAVLNILQSHQLNVHTMDIEGEFITPTGAAIVAAIQTAEELPETFKIKKIGLGAGKRTYERPSILRVMLIEETDKKKDDFRVREEQKAEKENTDKKDTIFKLESNIDDCSGEALGYVMEQLFHAGARDVHYTPVFMKKNRPGWQLNVICKEEQITQLENIIFQGTTTIGIRRVEMERSVLKREKKTVETLYGRADVKVCHLENEIRYYPEYESVAAICKKQGASYDSVYQMIVDCCQTQSL